MSQEAVVTRCSKYIDGAAGVHGGGHSNFGVREGFLKPRRLPVWESNEDKGMSSIKVKFGFNTNFLLLMKPIVKVKLDHFNTSFPLLAGLKDIILWRMTHSLSNFKKRQHRSWIRL